MNISFWKTVQQKAIDIEFSGVIDCVINGEAYAEAFGYRDFANQIPNQLDTRFGTASGTKGFTAVAIAQLIEAEKLTLDTTLKELIQPHFKGVHPDITVKHLLGHTSGIGDYLDEELLDDINEIALTIPVQHLESPLDYLPMMEKETQKFPPGERFSYANSGYIALAIVIELLSQMPYQQFVEKHIFHAAGMTSSGFFRSDRLPINCALGYVKRDEQWVSNVFHLPIIGGGDGGAYSTLADMQLFWQALKDGQLCSLDTVEQWLIPHTQDAEDGLSYGYGFWLNTETNQVILEGYDAGVSFRSATSRHGNNGYTVISNTADGAWPIVHLINGQFSNQ